MRRDGFAPLARSLLPGVVALWLAALCAPAAGAATPQRPSIGERPLAPAASWHGRAIRDEHEHEHSLPTAGGRPEGWSAGAAGLGTGLRRPGGSRRVREIQRRLRRLGYVPGPVDGVLGRRTQAALGWFQFKHGLRVTGVATAVTVRHVRQRTAPQPEAPTTRTQQPGTPREPSAAAEPTADRTAADGMPWWGPAAVIAAAVALTLLGVVLWRGRRRPRLVETAALYELWAFGHSSDPAIGGFKGVVRAVSVPDDPRPAGWIGESRYLVEDPTRAGPFWVPAADVDELGAARQEPAPPPPPSIRALGYINHPPAENGSETPTGEGPSDSAVIDATCAERGWELVRIVRDSTPTKGRRTKRSGLAFALEQLAAGEADCLVVARLGHLARSITELGGLLDWFSEHDTRLVVSDIDLDTSTTTGRRSAQTLAAVSDWERRRTHSKP
jgi:peptidoglycan hydrolase-like protein with peptidoglycan-binding domain